MTSETHPTAVQTALADELRVDINVPGEALIYFRNPETRVAWMDPRSSLSVVERDDYAREIASRWNGYAQAIRERDEAIALLWKAMTAPYAPFAVGNDLDNDVDDEWAKEDSEDADDFQRWIATATVVREVRAFLSNFSEEDR